MNRRHISKVKKGIASIVLVTLLVSNSMLALAEGSESGTSTAKESTTEESTTEKSANNEGAKEEDEADTSTGQRMKRSKQML